MRVRPVRVLALLALIAPFAPAATAQGFNPPPPREHAGILDEMGGLYEGPIAPYVAQVGGRVATAAGRGDCGFHIVDTDVVNAFTSPPGCHIYITRGMLGLITSEDELAGVLGHEIGHVTANHAGKREQSEQLANIGAALLGVVTGSDLVGSLAGQAAQLGVLSYSRNQERESDLLSVRYAAGSGYSPYGMVGVLEALEDQDSLMRTLTGGRPEKSAPNWAQTHPLHADRITGASAAAAATGVAPEDVAEKHDEFLARSSGLVWGDSAKQGFVDGRRFVHPGLGIAFEVPAGFTLTNGVRAVKVAGPGGAKAQFSGAPLQGDLSSHANAVLKAVVGRSPVRAGQPSLQDVNGIAAVVLPAQAQSRNGVVDLTIAAYDAGQGRAYQFIALTPAGQAATFTPLIESFHRPDAREMAAVQGRVIQVVTVSPADTAASLAAQMAVPQAQEQVFRLINGLRPDEQVRPGQKVKLVGFAGATPKVP